MTNRELGIIMSTEIKGSDRPLEANMTNKEKSTNILAIIMEELNMPKNSTIGDIALALNIVDPDGEIMKMLKPYLRNAIIDEIKSKM